jgi:hypothetical protein
LTVPLYRTYSPSATDHFYTTSRPERDNAVHRLGYKDEGITGYVYPRLTPGTQPLYRAYKGGASRDHFYTTNKAEMDNAVRHLGYAAEGITGYVFKK